MSYSLARSPLRLPGSADILYIYNHTRAHTHTHTHIYIYIHVYVSVLASVCADCDVTTLRFLLGRAMNSIMPRHGANLGRHVRMAGC